MTTASNNNSGLTDIKQKRPGRNTTEGGNSKVSSTVTPPPNTLDLLWCLSGIPWRVLKKLTITQIKKYPTLYGTQI